MSLKNATELHSKRTMYMAIAIVGMMFFIFGFVSWVNAILIPYFRIACELTNFQSYLVTFAFYIAYLVMSIPASFVLKRAGFKRGIMYGFFCMAIGALLFVPAALSRTYWIFGRFVFNRNRIDHIASSCKSLYYYCGTYRKCCKTN